jgi:hypothetical protein
MRILLACIVVAGCASEQTEKVRVLTYNIGNPDVSEPNYPLRLGYQSYEDFMAQKIRGLQADIVVLQEVLPPHTCASFTEMDAARTCFNASSRPEPVRRVLGDEYSIVCDMRLQVECIGVKKSFGKIRGVDGFALMGAETPALPLPTCSYAGGECDDSKCDAEATVSAVDVDTANGALRLVHVHPNAPGEGAGGVYFGAPCRVAQLEQAFSTLVKSGVPNLVAGDTNTDLAVFGDDTEKAKWGQYVGPGKRFTDHGQVDSTGQFYPTRRVSFAVAIDKVLSDSHTGSCKVFGKNPGAPDPGQPPLDDGFDFSVLPGGAAGMQRIDHLAVLCELERKL